MSIESLIFADEHFDSLEDEELRRTPVSTYQQIIVQQEYTASQAHTALEAKYRDQANADNET